MRRSALSLLFLSTFTLGGCVAGLAASAVGAVARAAEEGRGPVENETAVEGCLRHGAQYGKTALIDVERRSKSKLVVWGTVGEGAARRSFECSYTGRVSGFKMRAIPGRSAS